MSFTQKLATTWSQGGNTPVSASVSQTGSGGPPVSLAVANGASNVEVAFALTAADLQSLFIVSTQALTLKANSSTSPDFTLTLKASVPLAWHKDDYFTNPITADVTKWYVSNSSGATAQLEIRSLVS